MSPTSCQTAPPRARRNEDYSWRRKTVSTIGDEMECRMIEFGAAAKREFMLESGVAFLNHGSFGAAPRVVLEAAGRWRQRMEANPDLFLREILPGALREAAGQLALFIQASPDDVVFVDNATSGVNAVLRALELRARDEILATTHTYGAVRQAIRYVCDRTGAKLVEAQITLPVTDAGMLFSAVADRLSERTRLVVLDHVSSPTGLIFPVAELTALAGARRRLVRRELSQVAVCSAQLRVPRVPRRGKARAASARDFPPLWGRIHGGIRLDRHAGLFGLARGHRRTAFSRRARSGAGAGLQP